MQIFSCDVRNELFNITEINFNVYKFTFFPPMSINRSCPQKVLVPTTNSPHYVPRALCEPVVLNGTFWRRVLLCPVPAGEGVEVLARFHCPVHGLQEAGG